MPADCGNLKVAVRVRPFNEREKRGRAKCVISMSGNSTTITNPINSDIKQFTFDHSYWSHDGYVELENGQMQANNSSSNYADQKTVFDDLGEDVLRNAWAGYNATLFAYGQTGSGKSYSMIGNGCNRGIVPIACDRLFNSIDKIENQKKEIQVTFSMLEIYNEQIFDLLSKNQKRSSKFKIREKSKIGFYVEGLSSHPCDDYKTIEQLMKIGTINRSTASTNMNATSSRSHMLITIKFKQIFKHPGEQSMTKTSIINLVDLAGSERANATGATGDRLKEGSAINKSLLMLGSVIEKLASGNPQAVIPYRNSVLTKLLKSALGGNSKTVMIAALSPADINYDETLSTLRYANRAKKIQNRAVINESGTEREIRELKAENERLLSQLNKKSLYGSLRDSDEVKQLIQENELKMKELSMSWEQKLEAARKEWESERKKIEMKEDVITLRKPYLQNVNEDSQLSGVIRHIINPGQTCIGKIPESISKQNFIIIKGPGVLNRHCLITCNESIKRVIIEPCGQAEVFVNGNSVQIHANLIHGDRVKIGSNVLFLYFGFQSERGSTYESMDLARRYDYDYFQNELAAASDPSRGIAKLDSVSNRQVETEPVYLEYIDLLPVVTCLNAMSQEMEKNIAFNLLVKNLTTCDLYGKELKKDVIVQVRHQITHQTWIWSKAKFTNRRFMIEELYAKFLDDPSVPENLSNETDPFWDLVEDVYLGCAHVWLNGLAYCMSSDDHVTFNNHSGGEEGSADIFIFVCSTTGEIRGDDAMIIDPNELLGKRFDFSVEIRKCHDVRWVEENSTRGIMLRYQFYNDAKRYYSCTKWHSTNAKLSWTERITIEIVDPLFLQYLHSAALVIELWGLQEGRTREMTSCRQDSGYFSKLGGNSASSSAPSTSSESGNIETLEDELFKVKQRLKTMEEDNNQLHKACMMLKKENTKLKKKFQTRPQSINLAYSKSRDLPIDLTSSSRMQAEMGRALKGFFCEVKHIQADLKGFATSEIQTDTSEVLLLSQNLDRVLATLKGRVSNTLRNYKIERQCLTDDSTKR